LRDAILASGRHGLDRHMSTMKSRPSALLYKECEVDWFFADQGPLQLGLDCEVLLKGPEICIRYPVPEVEEVAWRGVDQGHGHYLLKTEDRAVRGRASLHRISHDSAFLEGYFQEEGTGIRGMWRIKIGGKPRILPPRTPVGSIG